MNPIVNSVFYKSCEQMFELHDGSVQTCVTSPPYFGLRKYGSNNEIGSEKTLEQYIGNLLGVFREVKRVLRYDGTLWLNMGDCYVTTSVSGPQGATGQRAGRRFTASGLSPRRPQGLKPKDLIGVPWRVALALQSDGWWLRSDIIWHKPAPVPSSVEDRPTTSHEYIFLLSKRAQYYYDAAAIAEPSIHAGETRVTTAKSFNRQAEGAGLKPTGNSVPGSVVPIKEMRNKRDVWTINTNAYPGAHFATFPPEIPSLCIRAGSKPGDLVLDPFAGSGTTLEVAESLGRSWVGYELNEGYRPLIEARLRQQGLFSGSGV